MKRLFIVDSSSLFFRAFYAIRPLTSPSGLPVNAIYGYLSMILKLIKDERPDYLAFCYDLKEPSFRKEIYSEYKSNRSEMPEDLVKQIPHIRKISELLEIKSYEKMGYEADDLIGSLSECALKQNIAVYIVSGDKDFAQIVKPNVYLYDTMKDSKVDVQGVIEKWGVTPEQFCDYLAIVGDSSDNIPGVKGIGPKGAVKLLQDYKTLENIYQNIDKIEGKLKIKLQENKDNAFLSKVLVTIKTDVMVDLNLDDLGYTLHSTPELDAWLDELNFKTFKKTIGELSEGRANGVAASPTALGQLRKSIKVEVPSSIAIIPVAIEPIKTLDSVSGLTGEQCFFFLWQESLYAIVGDTELYSVNINHDWVEGFKSWRWSGLDVKSVWKKLSLPPDNFMVISDLMIEANTLSSKDCSTLLKTIKSMGPVDLDEDSSIQDIFQAVKRVRNDIQKQLQENDFNSILNEVEYPLIRIIYRMEKTGFAVDSQQLHLFSIELQERISILEQEIYRMVGEEFNISSPKQLGQILFQKLGLQSSKKTKTGFSTDNDVLERLKHPIVPLVLEYREITKLKSTYVDALPNSIDKSDNRIHTTFNQALTATGRLSSHNPNLQNIPIKTQRGQRVRQAFVANKGNKILSVDYSQIELRILAHYSNDKGLIYAFENDLDIHSATASEVFSVPLKEVTSELRRIAKAINFGIAYGQGAFGLSETLNIPRVEATKIIADYFKKFEGVRVYIDETIKYAHEHGFVKTILGRKRIISELSSKNSALRKFGERAAINAPIQGSASDIVKMAMIKLESQVKSKMILQVHDELLFESNEETLLSELPIIKKTMETIIQLKVPLKVNSQIAMNWDEAH